MQLDVTWAPRDSELDGDVVNVERATGFSAADLADVEVPPGVELSASDRGFGKGASGTGVALIMQVGEHVLSDTASLITIGYLLRALVSRIAERRGQQPAAASSLSLAALAASQSPGMSWRTSTACAGVETSVFC